MRGFHVATAMAPGPHPTFTKDRDPDADALSAPPLGFVASAPAAPSIDDVDVPDNIVLGSD